MPGKMQEACIATGATFVTSLPSDFGPHSLVFTKIFPRNSFPMKKK